MSSAARSLLTPRTWLTFASLALLCATWIAHGQAYAQEKESTELMLEIIASPSVNANETGRPSPIRVRIYELVDSATFKEADYFSLESQDKVILAADMLSRDEFILRPREKRVIKRKGNPKATAIGVLAGYRDLARTNWRVVIPLEDPPEKSWWRFAIPANKLERAIRLDPQGVRVDPLP